MNCLMKCLAHIELANDTLKHARTAIANVGMEHDIEEIIVSIISVKFPRRTLKEIKAMTEPTWQ